MAKINLNDVTFLIPVRIDSVERMENLNLVLEFLTSHFDTIIMVLEADKEEQVKSQLIDKKVFIEDIDPIFHRTKYLNQMTMASKSPIIAIWDTDVLLKPRQISEGAYLLRQQKTDFVIPYGGKCYFVQKDISIKYKKELDYSLLENSLEKHYLFNQNQVGGALIVNKEKYVDAGMENENFYGWGPEDQERIKRWEILGFNIQRVDGPAFHLYHPRGVNSKFFSDDSIALLKKEYLKVCRMNKERLINYVKSW